MFLKVLLLKASGLSASIFLLHERKIKLSPVRATYFAFLLLSAEYNPCLKLEASAVLSGSCPRPKGAGGCCGANITLGSDLAKGPYPPHHLVGPNSTGKQGLLGGLHASCPNAQASGTPLMLRGAMAPPQPCGPWPQPFPDTSARLSCSVPLSVVSALLGNSQHIQQENWCYWVNVSPSQVANVHFLTGPQDKAACPERSDGRSPSGFLFLSCVPLCPIPSHHGWPWRPPTSANARPHPPPQPGLSCRTESERRSWNRKINHKTTERGETAGRILEKFPGGNSQPSRALPG